MSLCVLLKSLERFFKAFWYGKTFLNFKNINQSKLKENMKKSLFSAIFVMAFMVVAVLFSACDNDYVSLEKNAIGKFANDTTYVTDTVVNKDTIIILVPDTIKLDSTMYQKINGSYVGIFNARVQELYAETSSVAGEIETYATATDQLISAQPFELPLQFNALMSAPKRTYVKTVEALSQVNLQNASENAAVLTDKNYNKFNVRNSAKKYSFSFDNGEAVEAKTVFESGVYADTLQFDYSAISNITYMGSDAVEAVNTADSVIYNVTLHFEVEVERYSFDEAAPAAQSAAETYSVDVPYQKVYLIEKEVVGYEHEEEVIAQDGNMIAHVVIYAVYSNGEKEIVKDESKIMAFDFNAPAALEMVVENAQFATVANGVNGTTTSTTNGNWTFVKEAGVYSSNASNGAQSFANEYNYTYASEVTYTYGDVVVTFNGQMNVIEGATTIDNQGVQGDYNVYAYVNNVMATYTVNGQTANKAGQAVRTLKVENVINKTIPEDWGTIIGAGVSAVPMDQANSDNAQYCLCIRTTNGAVAVPFAIGAQPSVAQVLGGYFVNGNFNASYNSGYYTTNANKGSYAVSQWAPAVATDEANMIVYSSNGQPVRCISKATLARNNWRGGNLSTVVEGYDFAVSANGTLTVSFNGQEIMRIR